MEKERERERKERRDLCSYRNISELKISKELPQRCRACGVGRIGVHARGVKGIDFARGGVLTNCFEYGIIIITNCCEGSGDVMISLGE